MLFHQRIQRYSLWREQLSGKNIMNHTLLHSLAQHVSDIITLLDAEGTIHYENPAAERILGYKVEDLLGRNAFDFVHPEDKSRVYRRFLEQIKQPGVALPISFRFRHANGSWVCLESVGNNLLDEPEVGYLVVNSRDVTRRQQVEEQLHLLEAAVQNATEAILITDTQLDAPGPCIVFASTGFEALTGYRADEVIGRNPRFLQGPATDPDVLKQLRLQLDQGKPFVGETTNYRKDGSPFVVEWSVSPIYDASGTISHFISVQRDITARKRAEWLEEDHRRFLEMVVANYPLPTILGHLAAMMERQYPQQWCEIFLLQAEHLSAPIIAPARQNRQHGQHGQHGQNGQNGQHPPRPHSNGHICPCILDACEQQEMVLISRTQAMAPQNYGCMRMQEAGVSACRALPIIASQGQILGALVLHDTNQQPAEQETLRLMLMAVHLAAVAIEQRQLLDRLEHQAHHDALTNLPNRVLFEKRLQAALHEADYYESMVALLFIDLDRFKQVNDSLGHHIGDILLQQVAERLHACTGPHDTMARMGGDEFALIMPHISDMQRPTSMAQRILATLQTPFFVLEHQIFLTANIGISLYPLDAANSTDLQRNADLAMYRTKRRGVSSFEYFAREMHFPLRDSLLKQMEIEEHLHRASLFDELQLYYQPQVELGTGSIVCVEVLLRWQHPEMGMLSPTQFIPVMERTGLIRPVGTWVIQEACRQLCAWQQMGCNTVSVAINVSAEQFAQPDFVLTVERILHQNRLPPDLLEFEITESLMLSDFELTTHHLAGLKRLGVSLALDDFGTGHAALANLQRFPIDTIKIDRSFMQDFVFPDTQTTQALDLLQTIVILAQKLHMCTVVEGIETDHQAVIAHRIGSERAQGYWFSKPVSAEACTALLQQNQQQTHVAKAR